MTDRSKDKARPKVAAKTGIRTWDIPSKPMPKILNMTPSAFGGHVLRPMEKMIAMGFFTDDDLEAAKRKPAPKGQAEKESRKGDGQQKRKPKGRTLKPIHPGRWGSNYNA